MTGAGSTREMEALLLARAASRKSALLRSRPALHPRASRTELGLLGGLRGLPRPTVLPVGAPARTTEPIRLRRACSASTWT